MRLFIALPLPAQTRTALAAWAESCGPRPNLRWTHPEQLHFTLHFLGEVEEDRVNAVIAALDGIARPAFPIEFDKLEAMGHAGVLAAAAKLTPPFAALEVEVRTRVSAFGENRDAHREFRPHVTLARSRRGATVPKPRSLPPLPELKFAADCFRLYRSELQQNGAEHTMLHEWKLS
jgi:RNA 2',3'-cyclic 3'-phosphodiesterase